MLIAALTIFSAIMGALAPTIVNLYLLYTKEPAAPEIIRTYPYRFPFIGMFLLIIISGAFLVYAAIKEYRKNKNTKSNKEYVSMSDTAPTRKTVKRKNAVKKKTKGRRESVTSLSALRI